MVLCGHVCHKQLLHLSPIYLTVTSSLYFTPLQKSGQRRMAFISLYIWIPLPFKIIQVIFFKWHFFVMYIYLEMIKLWVSKCSPNWWQSHDSLKSSVKLTAIKIIRFLIKGGSCQLSVFSDKRIWKVKQFYIYHLPL